MAKSTTNQHKKWTSERSFRTLLAFVFAASGFSALTYQVAWQRVLAQSIGSDAVSVVLVVSAFMAFLGIGAEIARRVLRNPGKDKLLLYVLIEAGVGVYGLCSVGIIRFINGLWSETGYNSLTLDALLNLSLLALPVVGMGMTTPLVVHFAKRRLDDLGRVVGFYYGLNIFGASIGALVTGLVLIEVFGLFGTTVIAAVINVLISIVFFVFLRERRISETNYSNPTVRAGFRKKLIFAAISFGLCTLAVQIGLFRVATNYFTMSTVVFPVVLFVYLVLMAGGQWLGGRLSDKYFQHLPTVICWLFISGVICLTLALNFPPSLAADFGALRFTTFNGGLLSEHYFSSLVGDANPFIIIIFSFFLFLVVLFWAALFPVTLRLATHAVENAGEQFARLFMLYTLGNVIGTGILGLYIIPAVGTGTSMVFTVLVGFLGVISIIGVQRLFFLALPIVGFLIFFIPQDYYKKFELEEYKISEVFEGINGVVTTVETGRFYKIVDMNRTASASAIVHDPQDGDFYEAWRWNLTELLVLDPLFRPKDILIIGIGHAYLIDALLDLPTVENIVVVDISSEVVDAVKQNTKSSTIRVFDDPRVTIVIADGRRYIQKAIANGMEFDLIQTKINEPWHAGSSSLFSVEFFAMQKALLRQGGYLGVRPLAGHVKDALGVFPVAVFPGEYHVYFRNGIMERPVRAIVTPDIEDLWFRLLPGRPQRGPRAKVLSVTFFDTTEPFDTIPHNTDDWPSFEYYYLRSFFDKPHRQREWLSSERYAAWRKSIPVVFERIE